MKLLSEPHLRQIESHLGRLLDRILHATELGPLNDCLRKYVLARGKRVRPQLCVWTYLKSCRESASGKLPDLVLNLACGWELFHAFLLCHDDIIDGADRRRNSPSLHRQLQSLDHDCPRFGMNLGIVGGDLLFSGAMRLWHELEVPPRIYREELRLFSRIACTTGFGQAMDICQSQVPLGEVREEVLLREYHWKTAGYTFEGPMLSGAILAGADEATRDGISRFALALGQAYQLQNDLLDLAMPVHEGSDLMQGKRTIPLIRARGAMDREQRVSLDRKLDSLATANGDAVRICEEIRREISRGSASEEASKLIEGFLAMAGKAARDSKIAVGLRRSLKGLLGELRENYFDSESQRHKYKLPQIKIR